MRTATKAIALVVLGASVAAAVWPRAVQQGNTDGRLSFTAHAPVGGVKPGVEPLGLGTSRDGFVFVPSGNSAKTPAPLLILLHGATQSARLFERITGAADSAGVVILAPDSRATTWDAIRGDFGPDIAFLDRAINRAFDRAHIDACKVVVGGFSDGASYALSLGIRNARLLKGVVAFSPGFVIPAEKAERLPVFMRHGTNDQILPIDRTSRPLQRALSDAGFELDYQEFEGPHTVRPADARDAFRWVRSRTCFPYRSNETTGGPAPAAANASGR